MWMAALSTSRLRMRSTWQPGYATCRIIWRCSISCGAKKCAKNSHNRTCATKLTLCSNEGASRKDNVMNERPVIVCLCGSTRFSEAFHDENLRETLLGRIVLSIGCDFKSDRDLIVVGDLTEEDKERLDELHLRKIDLADEILVLNIGGYIRLVNRHEKAYGKPEGKRITYLEEFGESPSNSKTGLYKNWPHGARN